MWFLFWFSMTTSGPVGDPAAVFRQEGLCRHVADVLNLDKPSWGRYDCVGVEGV